MESWRILPETPLDAPGPASEAFRQIGCGSYRSAARHLHELPYGRNSDRASYLLVLSERRGTCSTKHALLAAVACEQNLPIALTIGIYDMTEANTPGVGRVLSAHGLESLPEAHCYLTYAGRRVDITRSGVSPQSAILHFHEEWAIEPPQIGAHKLALHHHYLRGVAPRTATTLFLVRGALANPRGLYSCAGLRLTSLVTFRSPENRLHCSRRSRSCSPGRASSPSNGVPGGSKSPPC